MRLFFFLYYIFIFFHLSFQSTFVSLKICISNTLFISSLCVGGVLVACRCTPMLVMHWADMWRLSVVLFASISASNTSTFLRAGVDRDKNHEFAFRLIEFEKLHLIEVDLIWEEDTFFASIGCSYRSYRLFEKQWCW